MNRNRLEAFSDGVIAIIIITIMVLELKTPHGESWSDLWPLLPVIEAYVFSFLYVAIYWVNHHHLLHAATKVNGAILWSNIHLLFWLSVIPFATTWMGESNFEGAPVVLYSLILSMCGIAYTILQHYIECHIPADSPFHHVMRRQRVKGIVSVVGYLVAALMVWLLPLASEIIFVLIAFLWFLPDKEIERLSNNHE